MYPHKLSGELILTTEEGYRLIPVRVEIPIGEAMERYLATMRGNYDLDKLRYENRIAQLEKQIAESEKPKRKWYQW